MSEIIQLYKNQEKTIKVYPKTLASEVYVDESNNILNELDNKINFEVESENNIEIPSISEKLNLIINQKIPELNSSLEQNKKELTEKINEVATTGTTTEVLKSTTETFIQEKIEDGTIANLTIENNSVTSDRLNNDFKLGLDLNLNANNFSIKNKIDTDLTVQPSSNIINTGICKIPSDCDYIYCDLAITNTLVSLFFLNGNTSVVANVIEKYGDNKAIKQAIKIPSNATHFLIQQNKENIEGISVFFIKNEVEIITNKDLSQNLQIKTDGTYVNTSTSQYCSEFISLEDVYKIKISGFTTDRNIINYYTNKSLDSWISGDGLSIKVNYTSIPPSEAKYCIIQALNSDTNSTPTYVELYKKNKTIKEEVERLSNYDNVSYLLRNRVVVSDTKNYLCGGDPCSVIDTSTGTVYTTYLASKTNYGETRDIIALSVHDVTTPHNVEHFEVAIRDEVIGSSKIVAPFEPNLVDLGDKIRIFFTTNQSINTDTYWGYLYRDFDKSTRTFENDVYPMKIQIGDEIGNCTFERIANYITSNGGSFISSDTRLIFTSRIAKEGENYYGALTSYCQCPVLIKSKDCETWTVFNLINENVKFETQIEAKGTRIYVILRDTSNNFYISQDSGVTFNTNTIQLPKMTTRPQIIKYKKGLLILRSDDSDDYKYSDSSFFYSGRYNLFIDYILANGQSLQKKIKIESKYTIAYYSVINNCDDIYITYHNGERFHHEHNKDAINYLKIGDIKEVIATFEESL